MITSRKQFRIVKSIELTTMFPFSSFVLFICVLSLIEANNYQKKDIKGDQKDGIFFPNEITSLQEGIIYAGIPLVIPDQYKQIQQTCTVPIDIPENSVTKKPALKLMNTIQQIADILDIVNSDQNLKKRNFTARDKGRRMSKKSLIELLDQVEYTKKKFGLPDIDIPVNNNFKESKFKNNRELEYGALYDSDEDDSNSSDVSLENYNYNINSYAPVEKTKRKRNQRSISQRS